jgi:hypothetical protein
MVQLVCSLGVCDSGLRGQDLKHFAECFACVIRSDAPPVKLVDSWAFYPLLADL